MTKKRTALPEINENHVENKEKRDQNRKEKKKIENRRNIKKLNGAGYYSFDSFFVRLLLFATFTPFTDKRW
jgi:hypothetical protein